MMNTGFQLNKPIQLILPYSNIDMLYGPYNTIEEAITAVPAAIRKQGLTVGIINALGEVEEYWWNTADVSDEQLKLKIESVELHIEPVGDTLLNIDEGEPIVFRFGISGRASISKGFVYQVIGGIEVFQSEFTNIGKGDNNSITITPPSASGVYTYRVKVLDSTGAFAKYTDDIDYIEYEVRYGGISINYNFSNFDRILIKNILSMAEQYFTANISIRDNTFDVTGVYLTDGQDVNIKLDPYKTLQEPNDTYIGFNYYIFPSQELLIPLNGKFCYIRVEYTENEELFSRTTELFTLLDAESLELISQSVFKEYYVNFPDYYTFLLKSGIANTSVYISLDISSDFIFEPVTVTAYNNFSLRIIPKAVKQNAVIVFNCVYNINNVLKNKLFSVVIGNINELPEKQYYIPAEGGSTTLDKVIEATQEDLIDGTRYYKIANNEVSDQYNTCAFITDIFCKINQTNNKNVKYVRIMQGDVEIGYINEDIINCRGISTDTPLNEWVLITLGYNLEESVNRDNTDIYSSYHAIYINGMVVKNVRIDDGSAEAVIYDPTKPITIELSNGILISKCYTYYKNNGLNRISPKADIYSIAYTNYLAHNPDFEEPGDLPVLKLMRITDENERRRYYELIAQYNEDLKYLTTFGSIGLKKAYKIDEYDPMYGTQPEVIDRDNATLFRQSVDIKKPALKEYAVLCTGQWMVNGLNLLEGCIIEVHTQGTSTLVYAVPNFKFTFWKLTDDGITRFEPPFVQKPSGGYYEESVYTAKADFMDSSHLNNTPTCNFYNTLIQSLIANPEFPQFDGSPSADQGNLDAIMGFPIVLEISDNASSMADAFVNIGSFMLNIDKTGKSLGFETGTESCLSLEGTSNDNETGAAGRFVIPDVITLVYGDSGKLTIPSLKSYLDANGDMMEQEIEDDYNTAKAQIKNLSNVDALNTLPYVLWCNFLSQGLEYRYPDSDIYKEKSGKVSKILSLDHFKQIYKMWSWVSSSDDNNNYKSQFEQHFDLGYCMLYFIQLMIFGQTDNLGKNAMFDCWDGEHWYPRPYDLDSQAGLDNNGNDNVAPFVEIKPEFSLNYNPNFTPEELEENYLLETSLVPYGNQSYKRYHYSSNSSKLWINFYKNYKSDIESFYRQLRTKGGYTPEAIINLCEDMLIDKLGVRQYNQDFTNKYLATTDQTLAYGNRWIKFKKWITLRFAFCDSYFGASDTANYNLVQAISYNVTVASPQYVIQTYQTNNVIKFIVDRDMFSSGSAAATKLTFQVNQGQVLDTSLFKYVSYQSGPRAYSNLISLDVSNNKQISSIESLVGTELPNLKDLNISNSSVASLNYIPNNLKTLTAENVSLNSISFPIGCLVETIDLKGSNINTNISFDRLPNLKRLDLTGCTISGNIILSDLTSLEEFVIKDAKFNGNVIIQNGVNIDEFDFSGLVVNGVSFDGNDINITKLNFHNTTFGQTSINMNAISKNVREIYFNGCKNLTYIELSDEVKFLNLDTFSIYDSPIIALGSVNNEFDASHFNNISVLRKVTFNAANLPIYSSFTFENTKILTIRNLSWNGSGNRLFYICTELEHIYGTLNITSSLDYAFWRCSKLEALPTVNIDDSVVTAQYVFAGANLLTYNETAAVIRKCTNVTNFTGAWFCKTFDQDTRIDLTYLFLNNHVVTNLYHLLCTSNMSMTIPAISANNLIIEGAVPSTVVNIGRMFYGNTLQVPYDIIKDCSALTTLDCTFASCSITFYIPQGSSAVLPSYIDGEEVITLTNAVNQTFFPVNITSMIGTFRGSNIQIIDVNVFYNLEQLQYCNACFQSSHGGRFDVDLQIDTLWSRCPSIKNVAGCFYGISNVALGSTLVFSNSMSSTNTVDISGLFCIGSNQKDASNTIVISLSEIKPIITTSDQYSNGTGTNSANGVFQNRKVNITDTENVLKKLLGNCSRIFSGATIYVDQSVDSFDLSNVTNCTQIFASCSLYDAEEVPSRKFVLVILPTRCTTYTQMFLSSYVLSELPILRANNVETVSYMFAQCVINKTSVTIPADYFLICKNSLLNTSYMFYKNIYITELEYNSNVGLFSDCINLSNVMAMFYGAWFLHKGVPNNLFGITPLPKVTSLLQMFSDTSILFDVEDEVTGGKRWMNSDTIAPLANLQSIYGMFSYNRISNNTTPAYSYRETVKNADNVDMFVIDGDTFINHNLNYINELFYRTSTVRDIRFAFQGFQYGQDAFCDSRITGIPSTFITDENNLYNIKNVSRMFGMPTTSAGSKSVNNLGIFVNDLKRTSNPIMQYIAGNLANTDISDRLLIDGFTLDVSHGHSLLNKPIY